jgi:UDP-glucose 4-epimerase
MTGVEIHGSRCLVTGGAGSIGSTLADQLVAAGAADVVVLDDFVRGRRANLTRALTSGRVTVVDGDLRDRDLLAELMPGTDLLFHQAAVRVPWCGEEPHLALEALVDGTFDVFEAAVAAGVRKVVAASTAGREYGPAGDEPSRAEHRSDAGDTLDATARTFTESLLRSFHAMYGVGYVALRYADVYGPGNGACTELLVRWMERIEAGEPPLTEGDGRWATDFVYTEDVARANLLAATSAESDAVFDIASGTETSLSQLAGALGRVMGSDLIADERTIEVVPPRLADTSREMRRLGWKADVPLEEGLRRLVDWWRSERWDRGVTPS